MPKKSKTPSATKPADGDDDGDRKEESVEDAAVEVFASPAAEAAVVDEAPRCDDAGTGGDAAPEDAEPTAAVQQRATPPPPPPLPADPVETHPVAKKNASDAEEDSATVEKASASVKKKENKSVPSDGKADSAASKKQQQLQGSIERTVAAALRASEAAAPASATSFSRPLLRRTAIVTIVAAAVIVTAALYVMFTWGSGEFTWGSGEFTWGSGEFTWGSGEFTWGSGESASLAASPPPRAVPAAPGSLQAASSSVPSPAAPSGTAEQEACIAVLRQQLQALHEALGASDRWIELMTRPDAILRRQTASALLFLVSVVVLVRGFDVVALRPSWKAARRQMNALRQARDRALAVPSELDPRKPLTETLDGRRRGILSRRRRTSPEAPAVPVLFLSQQRYAVAVNERAAAAARAHTPAEQPFGADTVDSSVKSFATADDDDTDVHSSPAAGGGGSGVQHDMASASNELIDVLTLMRHGERLDHVDRTWNGRSDLPITDTPLSSLGRLQAIEAALYLRSQMARKKVRQRLRACCSYIITSPFHRCVETAVILSIVGFDGSVPVFVDPLLSDFLQGRIFSKPPKIGGAFVLTPAASSKSDGLLQFAPASLALVTQSIAAAIDNAQLMNAFGIDEKIKARWMLIAEAVKVQQQRGKASSTPPPAGAAAGAGGTQDGGIGKLSETGGGGTLKHFERLDVWTSDATHAELKRLLLAPPDPAAAASSSAGGARVSSLTFLVTKKFPETDAIFADRIGECVGMRFANNRLAAPLVLSTATRGAAESDTEGGMGFSTIPRAVLDAEHVDNQRTRGILLRTPRKYRFSAFPPANGLFITHADAISQGLEKLVPRVANPYAGMSVPYASLTTIVKRNTYYTAPVAGSGAASARSSGDEEEAGAAAASQRRAAAAKRPNVIPPLWVAEDIGSTAHLQSKVHVRFTR